MNKRILNAVCILLSVICLADETEKKKDVASFREAVEWFGKGPHAITSDEAFSAIKKRAENCNLTQAEAIAEMTALAREYRKLSEDFSEGVTDRRRVNEEMRTRRVLSLIAGFSDLSTLPFFEEMAGATNTSIRLHGSWCYIRVAGVDSLSFIKELLDDDRLNSMDHWKIYETFGKQVEIAAKKGNINIEPCQRFLLEETKKEHTGDGGKQLDIILCKLLPDYTNSIQRIEAVQWFVQNGSSYHKNYFGNIETEIEKTPKEKRKDFKAKGELLDPERGK
jgi:hypothetical protein